MAAKRPGVAAAAAGRPLTAEALFRRALAIRRECLGSDHRETLTSQHNLALVLAGRGETAEAADLLEKALTLTTPDHTQRWQLEHSLAMLCNARGERSRALDLLRGVLATQEKAFGRSHAALIPVLRDLALVQAGLGDHLDAREHVECNLSSFSPSFGCGEGDRLHRALRRGPRSLPQKSEA